MHQTTKYTYFNTQYSILLNFLEYIQHTLKVYCTGRGRWQEGKGKEVGQEVKGGGYHKPGQSIVG